MVLKALYDYYYRCKKYDPNSVPELGKADIPVSFVIVIDEDGSFTNIIEDTRGETGKGIIYRLPFNGKHTNSPTPALFCDNSTYVFGFAKKIYSNYANKIKAWHKELKNEWDKYFELHPSETKDKWVESKKNELGELKKVWKTQTIKDWQETKEYQKHLSFVNLCKDIYNETKDKSFRAVCKFYEKKQLELIWKHQDWNLIIKNPSANITFRIKGELNVVADNDILVKYIRHDSEKEGVCLVTGEKGPIIRTATPTPIKGCQSSAGLMTFQKDKGFDSDGKEQCYNSPISYEADFAISTALKRLLSSDSHNSFLLGDRTYVFFASTNSKEAIDAENSFWELFNIEKEDNPDANVLSIKKSFLSIFSGNTPIKCNDMFFIIGIAPNVGREAIIYYSEQTLLDFVDNINRHFEDMSLYSAWDKLPSFGLYGIFETIFSKHKFGKTSKKEGNYPKNFIDAMVKSVFQNLPYPETVYYATLQCIRTEERTFRNGNSLKGKDITCAALIKAYINRKYNNKISYRMDTNDNHKGYLYGRLFAVLEKIQELSNKDNNYMSNICARYMNAASTTPAIIFPTILGLSVHHMEKIKFNKALKDWECEIMSKIHDGFATQLNLEEQGRFYIGYFHQYQELNNKNN